MQRRSDGYLLKARRGRREVEIAIRIESDQPSGVRAIRIVQVAKKLTFAVVGTGEGTAAMTVQAEGEAPLYERLARLEALDEAELLAHELDTTTADTVYEDALGAAASFLTAG
jgi:hypothetical protein